jgi:hypothetical protein
MGFIGGGAVIRLRLAVLACTIILLSVAAVSPVQAHSRSQSYSSWNVAGNSVDAVLTVKAREVTRLPLLGGSLLTLESLLLAHIQQTVRVTSSGGLACPWQGAPRAMAAAAGYLRVRVSFKCEASPPSNIVVDSFFAVAPSHVHYARVMADGELPGEYLFTDSAREQDISGVHNDFDRVYRGFLQYLVLGVQHILGGIDHLAFLAALLLLVPRLRELLWIVTGFTIGHSITLSLAVLGQVSLELWVIEALIGFTIALVAAENIGVAGGHRRLIAAAVVVVLLVMGVVSALWVPGLPLMTLAGLAIFTFAYMFVTADEPDVRRMRPALTLAFGLIHGFGFASVLSEVGLSGGQLAVALAGFNVGVELGQVAVVAALWWLLQWIVRSDINRDFRPWLDTASAGLCGLGVFWFVSRGFLQV